MKSLDSFKLKDIKILFTSFLVTGFIFLSGLKFEYLQFRYLILLLFLPCIFKLYIDFKKKKLSFFNFFFIITFCSFFACWFKHIF